MLQRDIDAYVKWCDVCLISKAVCHKPYRDLQSLLVHTHWWKDLSIDFVTGFQISANQKANSYDLILVIVNQLAKMIYYESIKVTIDTPGLAEVIIDVVLHQHGVSESIVTDRDLLFTFKFWSLFYYFSGIKEKLFTAFHPQTNGQTERQNSTSKHSSEHLSIGSKMIG